MANSRLGSFAAHFLVVVIAAGCSGTSTARAVYTDPGGAWQVEFPGKVTVEHTAADVVVYSARYGRDYYGVVDATVTAGRTVNLDDDANNAINSSRDALGAVAKDRVITPTTLDGDDARSFTASLVNGKDSSTITGVVVFHDGHVVSAIITDGLSNSTSDVKQFIASFVLH